MNSIRKLRSCVNLLRNQRYYCSNTNKSLDAQEIAMHKAAIASKLINFIACPPSQKMLLMNVVNYQQQSLDNQLSTSLRKTIIPKSLRENLIQIIENHPYTQNNKKVVEQAKHQLSNFFTKGIPLTDAIYMRQARIVGARKSSSRNTAFCPTYSITSKIFRTILQTTVPILMSGHFGIAKTFSFVLYAQLSKIIFKYRMIRTMEKQKAELPIHQLKQIQRLGMDMNIPKLLYWTIDLQYDANRSQLECNILNQCFQLPINEWKNKILPQKKIQYTHQSIQSRQKFYNFYFQNNIEIRLLVDQLNKLASAIRDYLLLQQNINKDKNFKIDQRQKERIINQYNWAMQIIQSKKILMKIFPTIQLTSVDFQAYMKQKLGLTFDWKHQKVIEEQIDLFYPPENKKKYIDLADFMSFSIRKWTAEYLYQQNQSSLLKSKKFPKVSSTTKKLMIKNLQKIKEISYQYLHDKKLFFMTPLSIRQYLQNIQDSQFEFFEHLSEQKQQTFEIKTMELLQKIQNLSFRKLSQKILAFVGNDSSLVKKKKGVLLYLLTLTQSLLRQPDIKQRSKESIFQKKLTLTSQNKQAFHTCLNRHLFDYDINSQMFKFRYPLQLTNQILKSLVPSIMDSFLDKQNIFFQLIRGQKAAYGIIFQNSLINLMLSGKITFKLYKDLFTFNQIKSKAYGFKCIPYKNNHNYYDYQFLDVLKNYKNLFNSQNNENYVLLPLNEQSKSNLGQIDRDGWKQQYHKINSKSIDLILLQKYYDTNKSKNMLDLYAFDLTVGQKDSIEKKIIDFLFEYINFKDKHKKIFEIYIQQSSKDSNQKDAKERQNFTNLTTQKFSINKSKLKSFDFHLKYFVLGFGNIELQSDENLKKKIQDLAKRQAQKINTQLIQNKALLVIDEQQYQKLLQNPSSKVNIKQIKSQTEKVQKLKKQISIRKQIVFNKTIHLQNLSIISNLKISLNTQGQNTIYKLQVPSQKNQQLSLISVGYFNINNSEFIVKNSASFIYHQIIDKIAQILNTQQIKKNKAKRKKKSKIE